MKKQSNLEKFEGFLSKLTPEIEAEVLAQQEDDAPDEEEWEQCKGSIKNDRKDHKIRYELIPDEPIHELAKVFTAGADKYGPDRWQNLDNGFNRYLGAAFRHLHEYRSGNRYDEETRCMHLAQVLWNVTAMLWYDMHGKGLYPFCEQDDSSGNEGNLMADQSNAAHSEVMGNSSFNAFQLEFIERRREKHIEEGMDPYEAHQKATAEADAIFLKPIREKMRSTAES